MNQRAPRQAVLSSLWMTWWGVTFIHISSSWTVNRKAEVKPRSKVLLRWQLCKTASQVHCCIYISFLMCIKLFRKKTKKQGFLWGILATFNTKQTNSTDFLSTFFYCDVHYDGDSFNRFTSGKRNLSKCNISIISYLTSGSPAQTKGLDCLCYCEPRTLKQTALSIMGTCVTYFYQHTYNGDLFNRFTSGVILSNVWGWQTRQWVGLRQILLFWCNNLNHRTKPKEI